MSTSALLVRRLQSGVGSPVQLVNTPSVTSYWSSPVFATTAPSK